MREWKCEKKVTGKTRKVSEMKGKGREMNRKSRAK
jgi:hypothetical protein